MKDDREHIDQLFESLNDRQFDIPEAFLDDLNNRLDNRRPKKKRYFFFYGSSHPWLYSGQSVFYAYTHLIKQKITILKINRINSSQRMDTKKSRPYLQIRVTLQ